MYSQSRYIGELIYDLYQHKLRNLIRMKSLKPLCKPHQKDYFMFWSTSFPWKKPILFLILRH